MMLAPIRQMIERLWLRYAVHRYARRLGPRPCRDYAGGDHYGTGQIRTPTRKCRLPERFLNIGYAAFLTKEAFRSVVSEEAWRDYQPLRTLYRASVPRRLQSAFTPAHAYLTDAASGPGHSA
jgi:hypothetical protein